MRCEVVPEFLGLQEGWAHDRPEKGQFLEGEFPEELPAEWSSRAAVVELAARRGRQVAGELGPEIEDEALLSSFGTTDMGQSLLQVLQGHRVESHKRDN